MLSFLQKFSIFCFLDNHEYAFDTSYECLAGAGVIHSLLSDGSITLQDVDQNKEEFKDWVFGHIAYEIKNKIENLKSCNPDKIGFPDFLFLFPKLFLFLQKMN